MGGSQDMETKEEREGVIFDFGEVFNNLCPHTQMTVELFSAALLNP